MFTALIIACHFQNAAACVQITDIYGPYKTAEECDERLEEMLGSAMRLYIEDKVPFLPVTITCRDEGPSV